MNKKHYKGIDLIRFISCIAIILYHLGLLKGGYLAVCTFFVVSGYLSVTSSFNKKKFSIKDYYIKKLKKLYLPLLVIVLVTISIVSFIPSIDWINLKPETTSVLLGFNNIWQLNANLDYFVRHVDSPFMHLWYISILLQFDLIFPFIYIGLKKLGEKINKALPCILVFIPALASLIFFLVVLNDNKIMAAYYGTFTRLYSLLLGVFLGFNHEYYGSLIFKNKNILMYSIYLILLVAMFIFIGSDSFLFSYGLVIATIISMRLLDYGTTEIELGVFDRFINYISKISYEIYLVQYPVIFVFQEIEMNNILKVILIIIITVFIANFINFALDIKKKGSMNALRIISCIPLLVISLYGGFKFIIAKDYTEEMNKLKDDLESSRIAMEQKQKEYEQKLKEEKNNWENELESYNLTDEELKEKVKNLRIVGIGDSIMELAIKNLYATFPNGYFDAVPNRTEYQTIKILKDLKDKDMLSDIIVLNVGTNGQCLGTCKDNLMELIKDKTVLWFNATNPDFRTFNPSLDEVAQKYSNVKIIDWVSVIDKHPEYLIRDRVHPTVYGCKVYANTIYEYVYEAYKELLNKKKEERIKEHNEKQEEKITFIGNDLLIGLFDYLKDDYDGSDFVMDKDLTYNKVINVLESKKKNNNLNTNIVLVFNKQSSLSNKTYNRIIEIAKEHNIYIIDMNNIDINKKDNTKIIEFNKEIKSNSSYISLDKIHLTGSGNKELSKELKELLNKKDVN